MINKFKKVLKSNALGRWLFPKIGKLYYVYKEPRRRKALQKYGVSNLKTMFEIADKEGFIVVPWAGTLLGLYRDGNFMKHDNDIDLALLPGVEPKNVAMILVEKYGYKFNQALSYQNKISEFSLINNGLGIDFFCMEDNESSYDWCDFFWIPDFKYTVANQNHVGLFSFPKILNLKTLNQFDIAIPIPSNTEEVLYYLYGKGWKTPDPNYDFNDRPGRVGTAEELGYSMTYDELKLS